MTALALLGLATQTATVDYQTLAKPLPAILVELSPIVGKRVVCDDVLAEDRLVVYVTAVKPRELIDKVAQAVAGRIEETDSTIRIRPDTDYEQRLFDRRTSDVDPQHEAWRRELEKPANVMRTQVDISALTDFVTPQLLKSLRLDDSVLFARPLADGSRPLPATVPDYHKMVTSPNYTFVGTEVWLRATRFGVAVYINFRASDGVSYIAYQRWLGSVATASFASTPFTTSEKLGRMIAMSPTIVNGSLEHKVLLTDGLEPFKERAWGNEPLNAITAPCLTEAASQLDRDFVACLGDEPALNVPYMRLSARAFLGNLIVQEDGAWVVATPADPRGARERRINRTRLAAYLKGVAARGYFDFWEYARYQTEPKSMPVSSLRLEAAAIGPIALFTLSSFGSAQCGTVLDELRRDASVWSMLSEARPVSISRIPRAARTKIEALLTGNSRINATIKVTKQEGGVARTTTEYKWIPITELGISRGLPDSATIVLGSSQRELFLGINSERKYVVGASMENLGLAIAYSEAGIGDERLHTMYAAKQLVPAIRRSYSLSVTIGDASFVGPLYLSFVELPFGDQLYSRETLPKQFKESLERNVAGAKRGIGGLQ